MRAKTFLTGVVSMLLMAWLSCQGIAQGKEEKTITIRYAENASPKGTRTETLQWWASEVENRTHGKVRIKFFWQGSLIKAADTIEGVGRGTADAGTAWGIYHPKKTPLWTVGDPPFSHSDFYAGLKAMQELFKTYEPMIKELEAWNVKFLAPFVTDMSQVGGTKKPVIVPDDAKGIKVRYAGGDWAKLWQDCGGVPLNLTYAEVYEGLMRGTADATQVYLWTIEGYKLWDVIKHFTFLNAGQICSYGIVINKDTWNALSPETQQVFLKVSDEFVERYARAIVEERDNVIQHATERGVKFYKLTQEQLKLWKEKAAPHLDAWVKDMESEGVPGKETQGRFLNLTKKWEAEITQKGYPWSRK